MLTYNRSEQLKQLHSQRKAKTEEKINVAIKRLIKDQKAINFNSVSKESGVSKATLYNNLQIKSRIEELRMQQSTVPTPVQVTREMNDSNKDALIASLKRKIRKLEEENKQLKEQVKLTYADIYTKL